MGAGVHHLGWTKRGRRRAVALRGPAAVVPQRPAPGNPSEGRLLGDRLELAFGEDAHNLTVEAPGFLVQGLSGTRAEGGTLVFQRHARAAGTPGAGRPAARGGPSAPIPSFPSWRCTAP